MNLPSEVWRDVPEWPYEVSSQGRVRNPKTSRILRLNPHKSGYLQVQLWNKARYKTFLVHRLVGASFLAPAPTAKHEIGHGDRDRHNNNVSNLRWVTHLENMRDRDAHGATARGSRNGKTKYADSTVKQVRQLHAEGVRPSAIAKSLGMHLGTVSGYINRSRRPVTSGVQP